MSVLFTIATNITPFPDRWRPPAIWLSWLLLMLACAGWIMVHWNVAARFRERRGNNPVAMIIFGLIGAAISIGIWHAVRPTTPPLVLNATTSDAEYPVGTDVSGIRWSRHFVDVRVNLRNSTTEAFENMDIVLHPDEPVAAISQVTNVPGVYFSTARDSPIVLEKVEPSGKRHHIQLKLIADSGGYRMRCDKLPAKSRLEIVMAIANVRAEELKDRQISDPLAVIQVTFADGTASWYGHGTEQVFGPKQVPKRLQVDGSYMAAQQHHVVSSQLVVSMLLVTFFVTGHCHSIKGKRGTIRTVRKVVPRRHSQVFCIPDFQTR